jgi:hypothetical protein
MIEKREILFRAKHVHILPPNGCFDGKWVYGYQCDRYYINPIDRDGDGERSTSEILIDPDTICEYTGINDGTRWEQLSKSEQERFLSGWDLKEDRKNTKEDWNGRKIFEGDIIGIGDEDDEIFVVKWDTDTARFVMDADSWIVDFDSYNGYDCEVIGNIFDNPELIEG